MNQIAASLGRRDLLDLELFQLRVQPFDVPSELLIASDQFIGIFAFDVEIRIVHLARKACTLGLLALDTCLDLGAAFLHLIATAFYLAVVGALGLLGGLVMLGMPAVAI